MRICPFVELFGRIWEITLFQKQASDYTIERLNSIN